MYQIRIDCFDETLKGIRTLFEYDFQSKDQVLGNVILPYLKGDLFIFAGAKIGDQNIRKVEIYETEKSIKQTVDEANHADQMFDPYTRENILCDNELSNVTRLLIQEGSEILRQQEKNEKKEEKLQAKKPMLFISHSSADEAIASSLVTMLRTLGFNKRNLFCSSVPGYDISEGEDIYDALATKFIEYDIYVILLLSKNYYDSVACLNEMGATWVLKAKYSTIVCPGFTVPEIKGAVNPRKMAVVLNDSKRVNGKLNQLKDHLIEFFHLPEVEDDTIWENDRNEFLKSIEIEKVNVNSNIR